MTPHARRRSTTAAAVGAALLVGTTAGVAIGRVGSAGEQPTHRSAAPASSPATPGADLALVNADLRRPESCADLLDAYVERGVDLVGPWGWDGFGPIVRAWDIRRDAVLPLAAQESPQAGAASPRASGVTNGPTGTNVQEAGVDEPDVVKTDGETLWQVVEDDLVAYDVSGAAGAGEPPRLSEVELPDLREAEILLAGDRVVALGPERGDEDRLTRMVVVDVADPAEPVVVDSQVLGGTLSAARLHPGDDGPVVRLVVATALPDLGFVHPTRKRSAREAEHVNEAIVRATTLADWLPTIARDGAAEPLVDCSEVAVPDEADGGLGTVSVVALDPAAPTERSVSAVMTASDTAYFSDDRFYLASGAPAWDCCWADWPVPRGWWPGDGDGTTSLYAFALEGTETTYVASGEVEGAIRDRWAMDSVDGVLRVAVGETEDTGNFSSVVTFAERGSELVEVGRVDKLGVGEDIKAVRWFDDLAIVVTFRQVDPLYAVDLSDPAAPELISELKIPGFSEYLHPLGPARMIGMGQATNRRGWSVGAQAALFDVSDLSDVRRIDTVGYPRHSQAGAGLDPRQFTWLPERRTALTVVSKGWRGRTGWVSVLELGHNRMAARLVAVEYGDDVDRVRLVPLPSGDVVLAAGDGVSWFPL